MPFRLPWVTTGQRIDPLDFRRMARAIEDWSARLVMDLIHDPDDATATRGAVLWGLSVSTTTVGGEPAVVVQPGVAVLGASAGENAGRLVVLQGPTTVVLTPPGAGTRNDCICIRLPGTSLNPAPSQLTTPEMRPFRRINNQGQPVQALEEVNTEREPIGVLTVINGVASVANPAVNGAYLRLASWVLDDEGAFDDLTDLRYMVLPGAAGEAGVTNDGGRYYFRGLRKAWTWATSAVDALRSRVHPHIDADGDLTQTHTTHDGIDIVIRHIVDNGTNGFPADPGTPVIDFGTRRPLSSVPPLAPGYRTLPSPSENASSTAGAYANDADGLRLNAATTVRAFANILPDRTEADQHQWHGQNVTSIERLGAGQYTVTFSALLFDGPYGDLHTGKWRVRCGQVPSGWSGDTSLAPLPCSISVSYNALDGEGIAITVRSWSEAGGEWTAALADIPFWLELLGPCAAGWVDVV